MGVFTAGSLFVTAGVLAITGALLFWRARSARGAWALAILGMAEMLCFAVLTTHTAEINFGRQTNAIKGFLQRWKGDFRIYNTEFSLTNSAMTIGANDIWGYDPVIPRRYAEYMRFTQNIQRAGAEDVFFYPGVIHPSFAMLRLKFMIVHQDDGRLMVTEPPEVPNPMPHVQLMRDYVVLADRKSIFARMASPWWDPHETVILESAPFPAPEGESGAVGAAGFAHIVSASTDSMVIEADLPQPAILLVTDGYSRFWRASALPGSNQQRYAVMPANYCLRAVPLAAGRHLFRLDYRPKGFLIGRWVSLGAGVVYLALLVLYLRLRKRRVELVATCPEVTDADSQGSLVP